MDRQPPDTRCDRSGSDGIVSIDPFFDPFRRNLFHAGTILPSITSARDGMLEHSCPIFLLRFVTPTTKTLTLFFIHFFKSHDALTVIYRQFVQRLHAGDTRGRWFSDTGDQITVFDSGMTNRTNDFALSRWIVFETGRGVHWRTNTCPAEMFVNLANQSS